MEAEDATQAAIPNDELQATPKTPCQNGFPASAESENGGTLGRHLARRLVQAKGVRAYVVTFTIGGLNVINAIASAYSENMLVICIAGGPNSNDYGTNCILHHTFSQELRCFQTVACLQELENEKHPVSRE